MDRSQTLLVSRKLYWPSDRRIKVKRSEIKSYSGCNNCGAMDIGDVWKCPECTATSGFYAMWMGFKRKNKYYVCGSPEENPDFVKFFNLIGG